MSQHNASRLELHHEKTIHPARATLHVLMVVAMLIPGDLSAEPGDPLFGADAPALDATAPEPTPFQRGDYGVAEETGAATYSFPLSVPPGRGVAPKLDLTYSSRAGLRGGIAAGWSLDLPFIEMDTSAGTFERDGRYTASLGGASGLLVEVEDATAYAGGVAYRLEQDDSFSRFEHVPAGSSGHWVALTSDGSRHEFSSADGQPDWRLARQEDASGNAITYHWADVRDATGALVDRALDKIEYSENAAAGFASHARVSFEYADTMTHFDHAEGESVSVIDLETCPNSEVPIGASFDYRTGFKRYRGARRLTAIATHVRDQPGANWREVERIALSYDQSALSCHGTSAPLRFLKRIERTAVAPDGTPVSSPSVTFAYGDWNQDRSASSSVAMSRPPHHGNQQEMEGTLLEIDGDGIPDRVQVAKRQNGCELQWFRGLPGGGYDDVYSPIALPSLPWAIQSWAMQSPSSGEICTLSAQTTQYRSSPPTTNGVGQLTCTHGMRNNYHFADVNGDGRDDLMTAVDRDPGIEHAQVAADSAIQFLDSGAIQADLGAPVPPVEVPILGRNGALGGQFLNPEADEQRVFLASDEEPKRFVVEAESPTQRIDGSGRRWRMVPWEDAGAESFANARGDAYLRLLPDSGGGTAPGEPPFADYRLRVTEPGKYRLYTRWTGQHAGSDSLYVGIVELQQQTGRGLNWYRLWGGRTADFADTGWRGDGHPEITGGWGGYVPVTWEIPAAGDYTLRFSMREDGAALDAFVLQREEPVDNLEPPTGAGPVTTPAELEPLPGGVPPTFRHAAGSDISPRFVIEAENFTRRVDGFGQSWQVAPSAATAGEVSYTNASGGSYVHALPDINNGTGPFEAPFLDYKLYAPRGGRYRLWLRWSGRSKGSDSVYASVAELSDGPGGKADWFRFAHSRTTNFGQAGWQGDAGPERTDGWGNDAPAVFTFPKAGVYTLRLSMREDGAAIDRIALNFGQNPTGQANTGEYEGADADARFVDYDNGSYDCSMEAPRGVGPSACDPLTGVPLCTPAPREPQKLGQNSNTYVWRIYRNTGTSFEPVETFPSYAGIPLRPTGNEGSRLGRGWMSFGSQALLDMDGDGLLDLVKGPGIGVSAGDGKGSFSAPPPAGSVAAGGSSWTLQNLAPSRTETDVLGINPRHSRQIMGLRDVNGDGLPDALGARENIRVDGSQTLVAHLNTGRGFDPSFVELVDGFSLNESVSHPTGSSNERDTSSNYYMVDVDGDGLADLLDLGQAPGVAPFVHVNVGDTFLDPVPLGGSSDWNRARRILRRKPWIDTRDGVERTGYLWERLSDLTDANGDGLQDLVEFTGSALQIAFDDVEGTPPRRLSSIDNGSGATIRFAYAPVTDRAVVTRREGRAHELPHKFWVVRTVTVEDRHGPTSQTTYSYADPVYGSQSGRADDPKRFMGFAMVSADLPPSSGGSRRVDKWFDYSIDARGRLIEELTSGNGIPLLGRTLSWAKRPIFDGQVTFTHRTRELTHHYCLTHPVTSPRIATLTACALRRTTDNWSPVPDVGPPLLFVNDVSEQGEGIGASALDRRTIREFDVRYSASSFHVLETASELQATGISGFERITRSETDYDDVGRPIANHQWIDGDRWATTSSTYNDAGNLDTTTKPKQLESGGAYTRFMYDGWDLFVEETVNELGHSVVTITDPGTGAQLERYGPNPGQRETWRVDGFGRVLDHAVALGDAANPELLETTRYYDFESPRRTQRARLLNVGGALIPSEEIFDGRGRLIEKVDPEGAKTGYSYDLAGNVEAIDVPDPRDNGDGRVRYLYTHDALGRVTELLRPDGNSLDVDHLGLTKTVTEAGIDRVYISDVLGRLVRVEEELEERGAPAATIYQYDAADRVRLIVDADQEVVELEHDGAGRRVRIARDTRTWTYIYDLNGNVIGKTSPFPRGAAPRQYTSYMQYDDLDRIKQSWPATRGMSFSERRHLGIGFVRYYYDHEIGERENGLGKIAAVSLRNVGLISYGYDSRGLRIFESRALSGSPTISQWVTRSFNAAGLPARVEYDDGTLWAHTYDSRGLPKTVEWYDPMSGGWRQVADYERTPAGQVIGRFSDFGQEREFDYDALGRPVDDAVYSAAGIVAARSYGYTSAGNVGLVASVTRTENQMLHDFATYTYDGLNRLVTAHGPAGYTGSFRYSDAGNVLAAQVAWNGEPGRDVTYAYGRLDPQAVDRLVGPGGATFDYDIAGNVIRRVTADGRFDLVWDGEDQLRRVDGPDGMETYVYDHTGNRLLTVNPTTGTRFYFGESETHYDPDGNEALRYHHIAGPGGPLARVENGTSIELQYADALQNLMVTMDETGAPTSSFLYGPFGEVVHQTGADDHRRQFNGKENDETSGLRYYGARYYDPLTLRWTAADPLYEFAPDRKLAAPANMNLYAFTLNNPLRYYDPDGREAKLTPPPPVVRDILNVLVKTSPDRDGLVRDIAKTYGIDTKNASSVSWSPNAGWGSFDPKSGSVRIGNKAFNSVDDVVFAIQHEVGHADHHAKEGDSTGKPFEEALEHLEITQQTLDEMKAGNLPLLTKEASDLVKGHKTKYTSQLERAMGLKKMRSTAAAKKGNFKKAREELRK